jgi:hypothetical protein
VFNAYAETLVKIDPLRRPERPWSTSHPKAKPRRLQPREISNATRDMRTAPLRSNSGKRKSDRAGAEITAARKRIGTHPFTSDQIRRYFQSRFSKQLLGAGPQVNVRCPFHDDHTPSMSLNLTEGIWPCHGSCDVGGGLLAFEQKLKGCDEQTAWNAIYAAMGIRRSSRAGLESGDPEARYRYVDADGNLLYETVRYPGKQFKMRRPNGKGGWTWNLDGVDRVLYNLPDLQQADVVFITEGEKDADALKTWLRLDKPRPNDQKWAATTNSGGAGKWNPADGVLFQDKVVVVFEDNDKPGRTQSPGTGTRPRHPDQLCMVFLS